MKQTTGHIIICLQTDSPSFYIRSTFINLSVNSERSIPFVHFAHTKRKKHFCFQIVFILADNFLYLFFCFLPLFPFVLYHTLPIIYFGKTVPVFIFLKQLYSLSIPPPLAITYGLIIIDIFIIFIYF